jgi:UDP-N-acetylmuramoyl-L-alanyl-D-glutamate--2,6-diaminopimelate ligase
VIGTLGAGFPGDLCETGFTTPEAAVLMRYLADFRDQGAAACALEASSIGIEECRMSGLRVDVAVFTNLTRDHLDYHGTMAAYAAAKEKLFHWPRLRTAVINLDDEFGIHLMRESSAMRLIGYSCGEPRRDFPALVRAENIVATPFGQRFELVMPKGRCLVDTALPGQYNISNLLACAAVLYDAGVMPAEIARRLSELTPPAGRMESLGGAAEPLVVVDYAHTPDALEKALLALRPLAEARGGKLRVVFGCGGDRDPGKRHEMGRVAGVLADDVWLTSDNPRSESPQTIIEAIRLCVRQARVEPDRRQAIRSAIELAADQDVILVAGKGHENYQEIAGARRAFSDRAEAAAALKARCRAGRE